MLLWQERLGLSNRRVVRVLFGLPVGVTAEAVDRFRVRVLAKRKAVNCCRDGSVLEEHVTKGKLGPRPLQDDGPVDVRRGSHRIAASRAYSHFQTVPVS